MLSSDLLPCVVAIGFYNFVRGCGCGHWLSFVSLLLFVVVVVVDVAVLVVVVMVVAVGVVFAVVACLSV